ncbi:MAG: hydantoinase/oxoprolinase family protein [Chloroflexi bacterium]|nr:hydantoinase/oxoprolinase family protein [Chloroflexota bacterium]
MPDDHRFRAGVDIGGTFTDLILVDDLTGEMTVGKVLTTPSDPSSAVADVLTEALGRAQAPAAAVRHVIHGTTLVTNAVIERKGARTALLTTRGYRDAYEIAREHRYDLYDLFLEMPTPLVPRYLRLEVDERVYADGSVARVPDADAVARLVAELRDKDIEAIAVCFVHSYANPAHERLVGDVIREIAPDIRVSLSSDVVPEIREYERTSTTVVNVYVQGLVEDYLAELVQRLQQLGIGGELLLMLSSGGISTVETASRFPLRLLESGPAGGALASAYFGQLAHVSDLMAFDMGGTTAKLCVIEDGKPLTSTEFEVDRKYRFKAGSGLPVKTPVVELIEIGAGGGSIARVDSLGLLKVGPDSAGADPGPVCYGRGGSQPTVTDADLLLGYLDPNFFLGGRLRLDRDAAERAIAEHVAEPLGMSAVRAAWGIHQLVNEGMASAARVHAIERGKDPRSLPLFAFGGAGPGHGFGVARVLHSPRLIVPFGAGVTSAFGFLTAPLAFDFVRSFVAQLDRVDWQHVNAILDDMVGQGEAILKRSGVAQTERLYTRQADVRYAGQGHEIRIELPAGHLGPENLGVIRETFESVYRGLFGRTGPDVPLEAVSWRVIASGPRPSVKLSASIDRASAHARKGERLAYFPEWQEHRPVPVYDRYLLAPGTTLDGPAIVEERESTTVVGPDAHVEIDATRNLSVSLVEPEP